MRWILFYIILEFVKIVNTVGGDSHNSQDSHIWRYNKFYVGFYLSFVTERVTLSSLNCISGWPASRGANLNFIFVFFIIALELK